MKRRLTLIISALMLMITNVAWGQSDYKRISDIAQLDNGSKVVFAARYNTTENEYYAMTAQASGKPTGVLFTSVVDTDETLPSSIMSEVSTFYWTVAVEDGNFTFTNANGNVLGYTSSTNFATGGDNTAWTITYQTSDTTAMVPEYSAFVVNNVNVDVRAIALNSNHNFGPYNTQNIAANNYNFFLDIFASEGGGLEPCATPTFTPASGTYYETQNVTIACETEDATIYYTVDGSDPTESSNVYSEPILISETTTVKAMATKEGYDNSSIATATYTIQDTPTVITIAEARALAVNEHAMVQGVVTFIDGKNVYVQDETAGICLFLNSAVSTLALGDMVTAYGTRSDYKGLIELASISPTDPSQFNVISTGNELPLAEKTVAEILADASGSNMLQSTRVQIVEATIGTINTNNNTPVTQDGSTINIFKMPVVEGLVEGDIVTFIGVISCYNNPQMRIASADDVTFTHPQSDKVATPTFTPASGTYYETQNVTINCETEDATIYYTVDGSDPSLESAVFTEAIVISETTTVKAFAVKEGLTDSEIATAVYTITDAPTPSDYTRITDLSQIENGSKVIFAARYNENANEYYAMTAQASGKPTGVLFTSVNGENETLPSTISDDESTYYWTVSINDTCFTFTNAAGDVLGYTSSTNFSPGGDNTAWAITYETSDTTAMVPEYSGFVVTNCNITGRGIALNGNHNFGPYSKSNMGNNTYNFFLDMFVTAGGTPVCATPTFTPVAGTYYEEQEVTISCITPDATIYYTLDGSDPTESSNVYSEPILISETTTVKAMAVKEGYDNSNIATAEYTITLGLVTIFSQDWEGEMNGWTFVTVTGSKPWTIGSYSGNHYAYGNGYNGGVNEQWCISPAFNLNVYSNVSMTFKNAKNYNGPDMQVYFSNDYDGENPASATWTELEFNKSTGSFAWAESGSIDLADFTGDVCYIGFKYTSTESAAAAWEVDDITLLGSTSSPVLSVVPANLDGFLYVEGNGPSAEMSMTVSGMNLTENVTLTLSYANFEISLTSGDDFNATQSIELTPEAGVIEQMIYVRLAADLGIGEYLETITVDSELDDIIVNLSGTVIEQPQPSNYTRLSDVSQLTNGAKVIFAARFNGNANEYYAMTAQASGKPTGVLFTSVYDDGETLPSDIADNESTYYWNVMTDGTNFTFTNAAGDVLGYSSGTNFATGGDNTGWTITAATSPEASMVPDYDAFNVINANVTNRAFALNNSHNYGPYHIQNMASADYNFFVDMFATEGSGAQYCSMPTFTPAAGTYFEAQTVTISCATEDATIYYTLDESTPTTSSSVYTEPLVISETTTVKAMAVKEGYENSNVATAAYVIEDAPEVITIAEAKALELNEFAMVQGIVTFVDGRNVYAQDETAGIVLYLNANTVPSELAAGDLVQAYGKRSAYNGLIELSGIDGTSSSEFSIISSGNELPLETVTIADILADYADANMLQSTRVEIVEATIGAINNNGSTPITQDGSEMTIYKLPVVEGLVEGDIVTFVGVIGCFNNPQMRIASADDIEFYHPSGDPVLIATPNALNEFSYVVGHGPSEAQTFVLTGSNLPEGFLTLTVNNSFEISFDGEIYTGVSITIPISDPTLAPTTVYVRLNAETIGQYVGTITIEAGVEITVALSGEVLSDGIDETLASSVNVWNNINELVIENNGNEMLNVVVYNIVGQPVLSETVASGSNVIRHDLAEGIYIVRIANGKEMTGIKVVVRR